MADFRVSKLSATIGTTLTGGIAWVGMTAGPGIMYGQGKWQCTTLLSGGWNYTLADPGTPGEGSITLYDDRYEYMCPDLVEPFVIAYPAPIYPGSFCDLSLWYGYCDEIELTTADGTYTYGWDADAELDEWYCGTTYPTPSSSRIAATSVPTLLRWSQPERTPFLVAEGRDGALWMVVAKHSRVRLGAARPYVWGASVYPDIILYRGNVNNDVWEQVATVAAGTTLGSAIYRASGSSLEQPMVLPRHLEELPDGMLRCAVGLFGQNSVSIVGLSGPFFPIPQTWWFTSSDNGATWTAEDAPATDDTFLISAHHDIDGTYHLLLQPAIGSNVRYQVAAPDLSAWTLGTGAAYIDMGYTAALAFPGMSADELQGYPDGRIETAGHNYQIDARTGALVVVDALRANAVHGAFYDASDDTWHTLAYSNVAGSIEKLFYYPADRATAQTATYAQITALAVQYGTAYERSQQKAWNGQSQLLIGQDGVLRLFHHEYTNDVITRHESRDGGKTWSELSSTTL